MLKKSSVFLLGSLLIGGLFLMGCDSTAEKGDDKMAEENSGGERPVQDGDVVKVHYTGTLSDGTMFDSSVDREPIEFTVGGGQMIAGFDKAVVGMTVGEKKMITIPSDEAYGPNHEDLVQVVDRAELSPDLTLEVGMQLQANRPDGGTHIVTITEVTETTVTLDANHPLAGKDLTFEIELVEVKGS